MALGTRDTNTMGEGLRKINGELADLKFAPDADVPFLIHLETEILTYLTPQGGASGAPGPQTPAQGGPPQGLPQGPPPGGPPPQGPGPLQPPPGQPGQPGLPGGPGALPPEMLRVLQQGGGQ